MRLALYVNGQSIARASLEAKGYLSAHLNMSEGASPDEDTNNISLVAYDRSEEPNTVASVWAGPKLAVGDKVEVHVLADGESDPPTDVTHTSASRPNLFSTVEQARLVLASVKACDTELTGILARAQESESPDELQQIRLAIATVLSELDRQLIGPTLRRHPSLLSEAREAGLY